MISKQFKVFNLIIYAAVSDFNISQTDTNETTAHIINFNTLKVLEHYFLNLHSFHFWI